MRLVGYSDRLSVTPGEPIAFMVSAKHARYRVDLVRLIHGDEDPRGPGFKEEVIPASIAGEYDGREQRIHTGSCVVPADPRLSPAAGITLLAWIFPTTPAKGEQYLLSAWSPATSAGYGLLIDPTGELAFQVGDGAGAIARQTSGAPLQANAWCFVAATFDAGSGRMTLRQRPVAGWPRAASAPVRERETGLRSIGAADAPLVMAAGWSGSGADPDSFGGHYNGKIDRPRLFGRALSDDEIDALAAGADPAAIPGAVATWDLAREISSSRVVDASPNGLHGHTLNLPTRSVTGANWTGEEISVRHAPEQYGAIHFHDDDLDDARWDVDFAWTVPDDLPSGVYAARLRAGDDEDHLPFVVRPRGRGERADRLPDADLHPPRLRRRAPAACPA